MITRDPQAPGRHVDASQELVITSRTLGIRVVAPAGSGKTETLVRRAAKRISDDGIKAQRILILSFDKSAKKSFEQKFKRLAPRVTMPEISTLNSLGERLLRQYFREERGTLVNDAQRSELNRVLTRELPQPDVLHWDGRHRTLSDTFKALKNQGILPADFESTRARKWLSSHFLQLPDQGESLSVGDLWSLDDSPTQLEQYDTQIAEIFTSYLAYDRYMRDQGWMDYDDQKLRPLKGLRENHEIRDKVRALYDEVIVDECQDINRLEALLIWSIVGDDTVLALAGDDDQSLYEFKEANSLYLREPDRHFGRSFETCHLNTNYRTPQEILSPALKLIDHNFERLEKSPHSGVAHAGKIELFPASTNQEHDRELASRVGELIGAKGSMGTTIRAEDVAVLCPNNGQVAERMRKALSRLGLNTAVITTTDGRQPEGLVFVDTMRKAKGRQWRVVVLPESNDSLLPGDKSVRTGDIESQRRQYYVAMTRPSETLLIGYVRQDDHDEVFQTTRGEVLGTNGASRFLFEDGLIDANELDAPP
ncbi:MAG: UvrD-helicase domain-containing protein, partial [Chloroflexota bacterium]|nr:UvrD-helicase domain-containing protein [Chloroflexota bacterium]